jgi:hypothetical protein
MAIISQHAIKSGFFVISGRNSGERDGDFHYYLKKQSQSRPLAGNPKLEFRNPKRVERVHLKKQSQFVEA